MKTKRKFYPIAATCYHCDDLITTVRPGHFATCECGRSSIDAGDELYWRAIGAVRHVYKLRAKKGSKWMSWRRIKEFHLLDEHKNGY